MIILKDVLLITPPFTQLNTPYPATAYLQGFLNTKNISSTQIDLGIEVILDLFSQKGLESIFHHASEMGSISSKNGQKIYTLRDKYIHSINDIIRFLQGNNQNIARQICSIDFLPKASRFDQLEDLEWAFGEMGFQDKAKHLATLYLEDLSDFIVECVDQNFGFSRYAERLGRSANSFDEIYAHLNSDLSYIDKISIEILNNYLEKIKPKLLCFSVPFPGNLLSAFRCSQFVKRKYPNIKIAMGGGFPNTELRSLKDPRVFEFFDFISLDDGELPLELIIAKVLNKNNCKEHVLKRTFELKDERVIYSDNSNLHDYKQSELGTPDYSELPLTKYISVIEVANPMHSLWSDGRWMKLTMAHGCYWGKCTFCDVSLDYIKLYEPIAASILVDRVEKIISQTGEKGFHFVDEAAPPALMKAFALEILRRGICISWWTNIRFEKNFTKDLCILLKASGCIAISGGLEVASDRLLALIKKGVSVEQVAQVCHNFTEAGIMVHAYLMYGYPTQTIQETIDSLELVRQLFELDIIQSAFWHQFALTSHSPIGLNPIEYNIVANKKDIQFADNDVEFIDQSGIDHGVFSKALKTSLFNFMHGIGFDLDLQDWFDFKIPNTLFSKDHIYQAIQKNNDLKTNPNDKVLWLGTKAIITTSTKNRKGDKLSFLHMHFYSNEGDFEIKLDKEKGLWLNNTLEIISLSSNKTTSLSSLKKNYENAFDDFELFWHSKPIQKLRNKGLLII